MLDTLIDLVPVYGTLLVFVAVVLGCFGVPAPATVSLIVAGAFVASGDLGLVPVAAIGLLGAVIGDQAGYWAGVRGSRWAGRLSGSPGAAETMARARAFTARRGGLAVFLSRWLFSPLGPAVNVASGLLGMPWLRFTLCAVPGKAIWVALFVGLGYAFSQNLALVAEVSGSVALAVVLILLLVLGARLSRPLLARLVARLAGANGGGSG